MVQCKAVFDMVLLIGVLAGILYQHKDNLVKGGIPFWTLNGTEFWIASNQLAVLIMFLIHGVIFAFKGVCHMLDRFWIWRFESQLNRHLDHVTKLLNHPLRHLIQQHQVQMGKIISRSSEESDGLIEELSDEDDDLYFDVNEVSNGDKDLSENANYNETYGQKEGHFEEETQYESEAESEYIEFDRKVGNNKEVLIESEDELKEMFFHSSGKIVSRSGSESIVGADTFAEQDTEPIGLHLGPLDVNNNDLYETLYYSDSDTYPGKNTRAEKKISSKRDMGTQVNRGEYLGIDPRIKIRDFIMVHEALYEEKDIDYHIMDNLEHFKTLMRNKSLKLQNEKKPSKSKVKTKTKKNRNRK